MDNRKIGKYKSFWVAYRENCVLVNDEDTKHCEPDRFSTKST